MPHSPVEGVAAFFGAYIPYRWRQLAGYAPHHEAFLLARGVEPLEEVVRRASETAAKLFRNAVLITEVRCEPRGDGWQIAYDAQILLVEVEPEETNPELTPLLGRLPHGAIVVPPEQRMTAVPMMTDEDWYGDVGL